jgi:phosphoribosyl-dephospho-CoA transferase
MGVAHVRLASRSTLHLGPRRCRCVQEAQEAARREKSRLSYMQQQQERQQ